MSAQAVAVRAQEARIRRYSVAPAIRRSTKRTTGGAGRSSGSLTSTGSTSSTTRPRVSSEQDPAREDVLHPLCVGSVGQEEEVRVAPPEHVDRRAIRIPALPASVREDAEGGKPSCDGAEDWADVARHNAPEPPHASAAVGVAPVHLVIPSVPRTPVDQLWNEPGAERTARPAAKTRIMISFVTSGGCRGSISMTPRGGGP
jgi:hypothetical protein